MSDWLRDLFRDRPWWMNAVMVFCAYMAFVYVPWDLFWKPLAEDREVWFGVSFSGWGAKLLALPHWFVYVAAAYGFRRRRPWMGIASTLYTAQVTLGMFLWPILQYGSLLGLFLGLVAAGPFALLTLAFWNNRDHFAVARGLLHQRYGDWALVTGASSGLGTEFARALAREGVSCVLSARRRDRLDALAEELERDCGIETRVVVADLCEEDAANRLATAVDDLEIAILVNNAGFGYTGRFDKLEAKRLRQQIELNCVAPVLLTHRLLPPMRARRCGAIVFTGSIAGRQPLPLHALYSASKGFALLFGESLWVELRDEGVDVLVVEPGSTATEFQEVAGELEHEGAEPAQVVREALEALGQQPSVITSWADWLRANFATRLASRPLVAHVAHHVMEVRTPSELR